MDNTPRGRGNTLNILWLDLLAQQALSAEKISQLAGILSESQTETSPNGNLLQISESYQQRYQDYKELLNKYYWNEEDGIYYDINARHPESQVNVKTPATFWPMVAGVCSAEQAQKLATKVEDSQCFGGSIPWASVSRDDSWFHPSGCYWRGGVWIPTAYMGTKALERYGFYELADSTAYKLLTHVVNTYQQYSPHTIWEVYSPTEPKPATIRNNRTICRKDFCGWSALAPISMLIENVLAISSSECGGPNNSMAIISFRTAWDSSITIRIDHNRYPL